MNDKHRRQPLALLLKVPGAVFSLVTTEGRHFIAEVTPPGMNYPVP